MKKITQLLISLSLLGLTLTACGAKGAQGETGPQGEQGEQGLPGADGKDGSSLLTGHGVPSNELGTIKDSYIDLDTWDFYNKTSSGWIKQGNIKGQDGNNGQNGQDGVSVVSIAKTSSEGNVDIYTITYSNGTTSTFTVTNGQNGEQGNTGEVGPAGKDGTSMLTGSGVPSSSLGNDGDSYINLSNCDYYVKENGEWVLKGNIKGSDGKNGQDAVQYIPAIFNDYDGSMLYTFYYEKGSDIVYDGPEPTREGYKQDGVVYAYEFTGWDKSLENIQAPTIFTAQYKLVNVTDIALGKVPNFSKDGKSLTYGLYPQTHVADEDLISTLDGLDDSYKHENNWYFYDGTYYAKATSSVDNSQPKFKNGESIVKNKEYWYICEPIKWNVLSDENGDYYLLSSALLDGNHFNASTAETVVDDVTIYPHNYEYSDIREWLNASFYSTAFALNHDYVQTTTIDNNLQDEVFLPSYQDYSNSSYGFTSNESRRCEPTDYARARGTYCVLINEVYFAYYWTRSPNTTAYYKLFAHEVVPDGALSDVRVDLNNRAVRPAITIKIA